MKTGLIMILLTILVKSNEIDEHSTHYDHHHGIGRIIQNFHHVHFHINITTLKHTCNHIRDSYIALSSELKLQVKELSSSRLESNLLKQAELLYEESYQNLQQISPANIRLKRGLINGLGTAIKYIFGNPDANDLNRINNYLNLLGNQQQEDMIVLNKSVTIISKISKSINNNTEIIIRNLGNISSALGQQKEKLNVFEAAVTLIIQEQNFLGLLGKIKRSFIFSDQIFDLEMLTYKQIADILTHLLGIYSRKELIMHYYNLLDFRFAQGSIVCIHDLIIYTLKIPILNPIEFSLFQRLSIINNINQTEIFTTPWRLIGPLIKLSAQKCKEIYKQNYLCQKIVTREIEATSFQINTPLLLAYPLSDNLTLISSNYETTITHSNTKIMHRGTSLIEGNDLQIEEHILNKNFGDIKQPDLILPMIIKDDQLNFESLKTLTVPTVIIAKLQPSRIEFHLSVSGIVFGILIILSMIIYLLYKRRINRNMNQNQPIRPANDEDVIELQHGGVM